jgi:N-acetylgalactosamine-6-sulfatase
MILSILLLVLGATPEPRPNLIFILADDLGYGDVGCFGSDKIETPNLDRLAKSGMRWTRFYAASAVCTPTRASCLTGRYPLRFGITKHFIDGKEYLPPDRVTLPRLLRSAGYATAHVGKWHLGGLNKECIADRAHSIPGPLQHGFEHYLATYEDANRQVMLKARRMYRDSGKHLIRNDKPAPPTDRHWEDYKIDESLELIERYHREGRPFYLNLWFDAPHTPYEPAPEPYLSMYKSRAEGDDLLYRSMVSHLDAGVGRIVAKLNDLGIAGNTFVLFTSDNGPSFQGSPGPWKGGKADLHEGGIRVPMIASWPGRVPAGTVCDAFGHTNDLLPTFCRAAGVRLPDNVELDGLSLLPQLTEKAPPPERGTVFWQLDLYTWYPQPGTKPEPYATEVARRGRWKLLARNGVPGELIDLTVDPREQHNLVKNEPSVREELAGQLRSWLKVASCSQPAATGRE